MERRYVEFGRFKLRSLACGRPNTFNSDLFRISAANNLHYNTAQMLLCQRGGRAGRTDL